MRVYQEYRETTNSPLYRKLHKIVNASCSHCKWHGYHSENKVWTHYHVYVKDVEAVNWRRQKKKGEGKFPSWKLVSKNKKQWMKKPFFGHPEWDNRDQEFDERLWIKW